MKIRILDQAKFAAGYEVASKANIVASKTNMVSSKDTDYKTKLFG